MASLQPAVKPAERRIDQVRIQLSAGDPGVVISSGLPPSRRWRRCTRCSRRARRSRTSARSEPVNLTPEQKGDVLPRPRVHGYGCGRWTRRPARRSVRAAERAAHRRGIDGRVVGTTGIVSVPPESRLVPAGRAEYRGSAGRRLLRLRLGASPLPPELSGWPERSAPTSASPYATRSTGINSTSPGRRAAIVCRLPARGTDFPEAFLESAPPGGFSASSRPARRQP